MKTLRLVIILCLGLLALQGSLNASVVTLTLGGTKTNDSITIGTNEVATVLTGDGYGSVTWEKDGISFGSLDNSECWAVEFNPATANARLNHQPYKLVLAGPAKLNFQFGLGSAANQPSYLTVQVESDQFPPDKAVIVPAGTGANIVLESSTNLINWTVATPGSYTNQTGNLFFRIRADRIP